MTALFPWESPSCTRIGTLRVRGEAESKGFRLALSGALGRADLRPPGLPPASVLIVRRMADPLPGRLLRRSLVTPDAAWERAARDQLAGLYRRAARPGHGVAAPDAEAIVFADEGELLASLALDVAGGKAGERWWWRALADLSSPALRSLAALLRDRAAWAPAALALLSRQGRAVEVVRALSQGEAKSVLTAVCAAHGASLMAAIAAAPRASPKSRGAASASIGPDDEKRTPAIVVGQAGASTGRERLPSPPWSKWLDSATVPVELDEARACLLGVALALHHHPETVRGTAFARELELWRRGRTPTPAAKNAPPTTSAPSLVAAPESPPDASPASKASTPTLTAQPPAARTSSADRDQRLPDAPPPSTPAELQAVRGDAPQASASTVSATPRQPARSERVPWPRAAKNAAQPTERVPSDIADLEETTEAPSPDESLSFEGGVVTAHGGVLFLINAMRALDLPENFEAGWRLVSAVGAWGLLEVLGRALLASDALPLDPIWPALASLSGRGAEPLGVGMPRHASYRVPAEWTAQMPAEDNELAAWAARGRRVRFWSRGGYVLSDTTFRAPRAAQLRAEAQRYGRAEAPSRARCGDAPLAAWSRQTITDVSPALGRWLSLAVPFIRRRLARSLGIALDAEALREALLMRRGQLYVTSTHVDLVMPLNAMTVPTRLAGLDRNPGWLTEFGRVILFHFED